MTQCMGQWQLELFFKRKQELQDKILPFLRQNNLTRLNITNKNRKDDLLQSVATIYDGLPEARLCVHYALKWNSKGSPEATLKAFQDFCQQLAQYKGASVLLVSGTRPGKSDSVQALQMLKNHSHPPTCNVPVAVAFNPYFPDQADFEREKHRLESKLQTGMVDSIYLQNGNDLQRLREGLSFIQQTKGSKSSVQVLGSVFLPSKKLLAQMKFRPWNGVFLSKDFLSSVEKAEEITVQILSVYAQHGVLPLLESNIQKVDELRHALDLFKQGSSHASSSGNSTS
ncbi:hypothetical protein WJX74_003917 [Apatococcus lobatus]|uniref:Methylenetetrahydrofolate reductase (NAD(P)H) n=1 Tax=Apatococcus lobatus TaxID=904363 RepID=A0AAW1R036_9CHLO